MLDISLPIDVKVYRGGQIHERTLLAIFGSGMIPVPYYSSSRIVAMWKS